MKEIREFVGEYAFMDNDFMAYLTIGQYTYQCVESAYQAERVAEKEMKNIFCELSGKEARTIGMFMVECDNWDEIKKEKLFMLTLEKYKQNPKLAEKLLATKNIPITHEFLGEHLMRVRDTMGYTKYEVNYGTV